MLDIQNKRMVKVHAFIMSFPVEVILYKVPPYKNVSPSVSPVTAVFVSG